MSSSDDGRAGRTGAPAPEPPAGSDARPLWSRPNPLDPHAAGGGSLLRDASAGPQLFGARSLLRARCVTAETA